MRLKKRNQVLVHNLHYISLGLFRCGAIDFYMICQIFYNASSGKTTIPYHGQLDANPRIMDLHSQIQRQPNVICQCGAMLEITRNQYYCGKTCIMDSCKYIILVYYILFPLIIRTNFVDGKFPLRKKGDLKGDLLTTL